MTGPAAGPSTDLHPFYARVRSAIVDRLPPTSVAAAALLAVVDRHEPAHWRPQRTWITCSECSVLSWPPPEDTNSVWSDTVYPCATTLDVARGLGLGIPSWEELASPEVADAALLTGLCLSPDKERILAAALPGRKGAELASRILLRSLPVERFGGP